MFNVVKIPFTTSQTRCGGFKLGALFCDAVLGGSFVSLPLLKLQQRAC